MIKNSLLLFTISFSIFAYAKSDSAKNNKSAATPKAAQASVDANAVRKVVESNGADVQDCYKETHKEDDPTSGKIIISCDINSNGTVNHFKQVQNDFDNSEFYTCLISRIQNWSFPTPKKGAAKVVIPFSFSND